MIHFEPQGHKAHEKITTYSQTIHQGRSTGNCKALSTTFVTVRTRAQRIRIQGLKASDARLPGGSGQETYAAWRSL